MEIRSEESVRPTAPAPAAGAEPITVSRCYRSAVELIGRRWAGAIVFVLIERPHYFRELAAAIPEMSDRLLSQRLRELEGAGIVARSVHDGPPARVSYSLTEAGRALEPAVRELDAWAQRWDPDGGR